MAIFCNVARVPKLLKRAQKIDDLNYTGKGEFFFHFVAITKSADARQCLAAQRRLHHAEQSGGQDLRSVRRHRHRCYEGTAYPLYDVQFSLT